MLVFSLKKKKQCFKWWSGSQARPKKQMHHRIELVTALILLAWSLNVGGRGQSLQEYRGRKTGKSIPLPSPEPMNHALGESEPGEPCPYPFPHLALGFALSVAGVPSHRACIFSRHSVFSTVVPSNVCLNSESAPSSTDYLPSPPLSQSPSIYFSNTAGLRCHWTSSHKHVNDW